MSTAAATKWDFTVEMEALLSSSSRQLPAWKAFTEAGLPGSRTEEYKYFPIARAIEKLGALQLNGNASAAPATLPSFLSAQQVNLLVFADGHYDAKSSVIKDDGLSTQTTTAQSELPNDPMALLHHALQQQVTTIAVSKALANPIVIQYIQTGGANLIAPAWQLTLASGSSATLVECTAPGTTPCLLNKVSEVKVASHASLEYLILQEDRPNLSAVMHTTIRLEADAKANCFTMTFGGKMIRNNTTLVVEGSHAEGHLYGLYMVGKDTIVDNHTVVDHRQPDAFSNELYKGVMDDKAKGVFNGKIFVRPHAQKTNAFQSNRNILLSADAVVNTKPQLEIWADDVKCSHGCTTGQLDEEALFYLRSRGISQESAYALLLQAFAAETYQALRQPEWVAALDNMVLNQLISA